MCYIVAKKFKGNGSYAMKTEIGDKLVKLSRFLTLETLDYGVQIITISDINAFNEYAPYKIIEDENEFIKKVLELKNN